MVALAKSTMLNKSGYFKTAASMKRSTILDFLRKSEKPEMQSYTIDHDLRKIQVKNTAFYWILPYICYFFAVSILYIIMYMRFRTLFRSPQIFKFSVLNQFL